MSWLDKYIGPGISLVLVNGAIQAQEGAVSFVAGTNVTLTALDQPNANPPNTQITIAASGGGGGSGPSVVSSTFASHPTLSPATWQIVLVDSSGGSFTLPLPTSGLAAGQLVVLKDSAATSATTGIFAHAVTVSGGSNTVQNKHTSAVGSTSYVWGAASQDGGGDEMWLMWSGTGWLIVG